MTAHDRINDEAAAAMLLAPARADALRQCIDALLRMIPEVCEQHGAEQITDEEHNAVIAVACSAMYGENRSNWPAGADQAAEGEYS